jgi:GNAT superfamily N-acetyltransferase
MKHSENGLTIRPAEKNDVPILLAFIQKIAVYEKLLHEVKATESILAESLFGKRPAAEAVLACYDGQPVGFAVFFHNFSTFLGRPGLYLEDLYVDEEFRGRGFGKSMLVYLARLARERNCGRFEWSVLDWNENSIRFYKNLGAEPMDEWTVFRLTGESLERLSNP